MLWFSYESYVNAHLHTCLYDLTPISWACFMLMLLHILCLDKLQILKALEGAEGLDPIGSTSNVGPPGNTASSYFSSLSI